MCIFIATRLSTEDEETAKTATKSSKVGMKRAIVPNNMPKFRQNGPCEEPTEFLEAFAKVMAAHEILQGKFANLLMLCLDSVDSQWLKNIDISAWSWSKLEKEFVAHFQHPNAVAVWQEKIRKLRMDSTGVQRYTDQFIRLAQKLHWQLKGEVAIY